MISWVVQESNKCWIAYDKGQYIGLVSRNPPGTLNLGMWSATFKTVDGGLLNLGPFYWEEETLDIFEIAVGLNWTYTQWKKEYPVGYP